MYFGSLCFTSLPFVNLRVPSGDGDCVFISVSPAPELGRQADVEHEYPLEWLGVRQPGKGQEGDCSNESYFFF